MWKYVHVGGVDGKEEMLVISGFEENLKVARSIPLLIFTGERRELGESPTSKRNLSDCYATCLLLLSSCQTIKEKC